MDPLPLWGFFWCNMMTLRRWVKWAMRHNLSKRKWRELCSRVYASPAYNREASREFKPVRAEH